MEEWVNQHYKWIFGLIYNKTGSFEDSRDLTQDTFLTAFIRKDNLKQPERVKYWLKGIAENKVMQHFNTKSKHNQNISIDDSDTFIDMAVEKDNGQYNIYRKELQDRIDFSVIQLPDEYRRVVVLGILCHLSHKECAEILSIPATTVNNRLHKAKKLLGKELGDYMENSIDLFDELLKEDMSKAEKVLKYLLSVHFAIDDKKYDEAEELLMKAPALAGNSAEAHLHIAARCNIVNRILYSNGEPKKESLFILAEQEFMLAEKLNFEGFIDSETGKEIPHYEHYEMMSEVYSNWGKFEKAYEYLDKSIELGNPFCTAKGTILLEQEHYQEALCTFMSLIGKEPEIFYKAALLNWISQCYKKLGDENKQLEYMLKEYEVIRANKDELEVIGMDTGSCEYYIALWYAKHDDVPNMLRYLKLSSEYDDQYKEWAKCQDGFARYRDLPEFRSITGEGEGTLNSFTPKAVLQAREKKYNKN